MDCHVIFLLLSFLVQRRILYVGFLDLNWGFQRSNASDDIGRHEGSGTRPCNNCTWNTHMPWIHCNCLIMCITRHKKQVCNKWFPATLEVALRKRLQRTAAIFHCDSCCTCQTACQAEWKYGYLLGKHMMSACVEMIIWLLFFSHCGKNFDEPRRREKSHWQ